MGPSFFKLRKYQELLTFNIPLLTSRVLLGKFNENTLRRDRERFPRHRFPDIFEAARIFEIHYVATFSTVDDSTLVTSDI